MRHPFELELSELEDLNLEAEEVSDEDLEKVSGGLYLTTMMVGEEGGRVTTKMVGEEGGWGTTHALGEEGGCGVTTMMVGEEGGRRYR
jgi:hypothetical protein